MYRLGIVRERMIDIYDVHSMTNYTIHWETTYYEAIIYRWNWLSSYRWDLRLIQLPEAHHIVHYRLSCCENAHQKKALLSMMSCSCKNCHGFDSKMETSAQAVDTGIDAETACGLLIGRSLKWTMEKGVVLLLLLLCRVTWERLDMHDDKHFPFASPFTWVAQLISTSEKRHEVVLSSHQEKYRRVCHVEFAKRQSCLEIA